MFPSDSGCVAALFQDFLEHAVREDGADGFDGILEGLGRGGAVKECFLDVND